MPSKKDPVGFRLIDLAPEAVRGAPWSPQSTDSATATAAIALVIALMRALRDRGVLSPGELDDILSEAIGRSRELPQRAGFLDVVQKVRADLEREDADVE
jgi:hypothetical protein